MLAGVGREGPAGGKVEDHAKTTPVRRAGTPEDIGGGVLVPGVRRRQLTSPGRCSGSTAVATPRTRPHRGGPHVTRALTCPVFDADNHLYETTDALTKFLPERHKHVIDYVDIRGRTKIVVRGQISEYIPNPTFDVVARPGAQEEYFRVGNPDGKSRREDLR